MPTMSKQPAPWHRRTLRWAQTNITEVDPIDYDIDWWKEQWRRTRVQGVILNAGVYESQTGRVDKGDAVRVLLTHLCGAPTTVALGDSDNDLPMLRAVEMDKLEPDGLRKLARHTRARLGDDAVLKADLAKLDAALGEQDAAIDEAWKALQAKQSKT